jgi:ATP-dependent protease HslVU (ClpYQ) peptidase subunit
MTVIIAIEHPETGERAIAADGRVCSGNAIVTESYERLATSAGPLIIGLAGKFKAMQIMKVVMREKSPGTVEEAVAALREAINADSWTAEKDDGGRGRLDIAGIGIDRTGIYDIGSSLDFTPIEPGRPAVAGSGGSEAAGAAAVLTATAGWSPAAVVREAVEIACRFDVSCGGEITSVVFPSKISVVHDETRRAG